MAQSRRLPPAVHAPTQQLATLSVDSPHPPPSRPRTPAGRAQQEQEERRARVEEQCGHLRLCPDGQPPAFELLVVGCGGGPLEGNLSSFLVKPYSKRWTDGCTGLDAGSTIGALSSLIERNPYAFEGFGLEIGVDADELEAAAQAEARGQPLERQVGVGREGGGKAAAKVWDLISCFAVTHAHLDHIAGLIISSAACRPPPKPVYGIKRTLQNIERIMDGGVWPMLATYDDSVTLGKAYHYKRIPAPTPDPFPLSPALTFHAFPLSHGLDPSAFHRKLSDAANGVNGAKPCSECYDSTAFFVKEEATGKEMLFFGDVEPDSISKRSLNLDIWKVAAPKIAAGKLNVIFLECSYPSSQPAHQLYGHFSPPYILEEMRVLADLVTGELRRAGLNPAVTGVAPLRDVIVVIQHIKDDIFALPKPAPPATPRQTSPPSFPAAKPLPPVPPPKDSNLTTSRPTTPSPTKPTFRPSATVQAEMAAPAPLLSMSPPVPSAPTRRPSTAGVYPSSPLGVALSRNRQSTYDPSNPNRQSIYDPAAQQRLSGVPPAWQAALDARRSSTPWAFGFGTNPFAAPMGLAGSPGSPAGRLALSPPPLNTNVSPLSHSAPPSSGGLAPALELDPMSAVRFGRGGGLGGRMSGTSPGRSPTRLSAYGGMAESEPLQEEPEESPMLRQGEAMAQNEHGEEVEEEEEMVEETVHERIERELNELEEKEQTGVRFLIALQGMRLVF
ncbi:hypothetical protein JCM10207_000398 [Rhodosporidiobolus poonsookiae]